MKKGRLKTQKGFSLVEIILALSLLSAIIFSVISVLTLGQESTYAAGNTARATFIADEGLEAVRNITESSFTSVPAGTHGLQVVAGQWQISGVNDVTGEFTREIVVTDLSASRKQVVVNVYWNQEPTGALRTVSLETVITDWDRLASPTPTPSPTPSPTLSPSPTPPPANWASPTLINTIDASGTSNATEVFVYGSHLYLGRIDSTLTAYSISNPTVPVAGGSITLSGAIYDIKADGNYLYVATGGTNEVEIVNITNRMNPVAAGNIQLAQGNDAFSMEIGSLFVGRDAGSADELYVYNNTNPTSPTLQDSLNLSGDVRDVTIQGNYAYVANSSNSAEFMVVNIANRNNISLSTSLNLSGNQDARSVERLPTGQILVTRVGGLVHTINVTTPTSTSQLTSTDIGGTINDASIPSGTLAFIGGNTNSQEFIILDVSNPSSLSTYATMNVDDDINSLVYVPSLNLVYAASDSNSQELMIFAPTGWTNPMLTPTPTPSPTMVGPTNTPTPTPTPSPTTPPLSCTVNYNVTFQWGVGFIGVTEIVNTGASPIVGWSLTWTFPGNQSISNAWNTSWTQNAANVTFNNLGYNETINPGGSQSPGFQASYSGVNNAPAAMFVNGVPCTVNATFP